MGPQTRFGIHRCRFGLKLHRDGGGSGGEDGALGAPQESGESQFSLFAFQAIFPCDVFARMSSPYLLLTANFTSRIRAGIMQEFPH